MRPILLLSLGLLLGATLAVAAQGPLTPLMAVRVRADTTGALSVDGSGGACDASLGPLSTGANVLVKADANGALYVCGSFASPIYEAQIADLAQRLAALEARLER